ncbi:unnamed protein product [Paramecium sonneborni]|uniref:Uncharacterized protein n=1 Tax=Paramecium sonneborni TaxID=65129 RepID=A0A8S1LUG7_9CILI|nr:unnamed protein product [Paramecium sonneborni]
MPKKIQNQLNKKKNNKKNKRVPVDSLKVPTQDNEEMDLFQKYGFGDLMKQYLIKDKNPIPSPADRILQKQNKEKLILIKQLLIKNKKVQQNKKKIKNQIMKSKIYYNQIQVMNQKCKKKKKK